MNRRNYVCNAWHYEYWSYSLECGRRRSLRRCKYLIPEGDCDLLIFGRGISHALVCLAPARCAHRIWSSNSLPLISLQQNMNSDFPLSFSLHLILHSGISNECFTLAMDAEWGTGIEPWSIDGQIYWWFIIRKHSKMLFVKQTKIFSVMNMSPRPLWHKGRNAPQYL